MSFSSLELLFQLRSCKALAVLPFSYIYRLQKFEYPFSLKVWNFHIREDIIPSHVETSRIPLSLDLMLKTSYQTFSHKQFQTSLVKAPLLILLSQQPLQPYPYTREELYIDKEGDIAEEFSW